MKNQAKALKNVKVSHKKDGDFTLSLDLNALLARTLSEADLSKAKEGQAAKNYTLASTGGFVPMTAPGFEGAMLSVNVIFPRDKYDQKVQVEKDKATAKQVLEEVRNQSAQVTTASATPDANAMMMMMMQQMQAMQAQILELTSVKK